MLHCDLVMQIPEKRRFFNTGTELGKSAFFLRFMISLPIQKGVYGQESVVVLRLLMI